MIIKRTEIVKTYDLTKYYGRYTGLKELNLRINQGEVYGFLGPNGAGKTTTIRLLLGLIKPSSGDIWIGGGNIKKLHKDFYNMIGYLPGDVGLYGDMSGNQYLDHFLTLREGKLSNDHHAKKQELMGRFSIAFDKKISEYSKGMKQVVGIIQAFMHDPQLLILDEPTSGLDPIMQENFYEMLKEEKAAGKTIFFSSHILSEVERVCDKVGMIIDGKLVCEEEIGEYRSSIVKKISVVPYEEVQKAYEILCVLSGVKNLVNKNGEINFFIREICRI